jgi:hypothetical protein
MLSHSHIATRKAASSGWSWSLASRPSPGTASACAAGRNWGRPRGGRGRCSRCSRCWVQWPWDQPPAMNLPGGFQQMHMSNFWRMIQILHTIESQLTWISQLVTKPCTGHGGEASKMHRGQERVSWRNGLIPPVKHWFSVGSIQFRTPLHRISMCIYVYIYIYLYIHTNKYKEYHTYKYIKNKSVNK